MKTFLALYMGSDTPVDPASLSDETKARGMAAWGQWMADHAAAVVDHGGPLGKTKKTAADGVTDIRNRVTGYVVVRAESQAAAAAMFENHPHFAIFPGDSVEIMERLPIPGAG
ncbi:hypothetical protein [Caulobacter sp. UNC279MFTsu5.1]|uniref:hypothetical protein n=1 Tax=Caulobacter sp. UNC279MFTsu5.1 TaxID=1502775 RepID=UPI0008E7945E|nr:hypothetical protein [Caulobacter sp. UNC279MFTsu5.1]SFJ98879.1 hypothetical protein SAMN02799626_03107 [Caulobacter sp. UNC279MFTsu5.1]